MGLDEALVIEGQRLHQTLLGADEAEESSRASHEEAEDVPGAKVTEVAHYLVRYEERVALAFSKDAGKRRLYGIGAARTWLARARGRRKAAARRRAAALAGE